MSERTRAERVSTDARRTPRLPTRCWRRVQREEATARARGKLQDLLRRRARASARPTRCWRRRARAGARGVGRRGRLRRDRTAAPRPRRCSRGSSGSRAAPIDYRGATLARVRPRRRAGAPARARAGRRAGAHQRARARATPSAGRTSRSCSTPGIDVYTTLNVQHLESLNDVVAQITGVRVRETVPDRVLERADEIELVDLPPDELLQRLREGKVYVPEQAAARARELLPQGQPDRAARAGAAPHRRARRRGDAGVPGRPRHPRHLGGGRAHPGRRRPREDAERLVRAGKRMATALHAPWIVVYVETPRLLRLPEAERNRRIALLRLAESLGAEAVTLGGSSAGEEIANYAPRATSRASSSAGRGAPLAASVPAVDLRRAARAHAGHRSARGRRRGRGRRSRTRSSRAARPTSAPRGERQAALARLRLGRCGHRRLHPARVAMSPAFELVNIAMVYLLAVVLLAARYGRGPAVARRCSASPRSISSSCRRSSPSR